MRHYLMVAVFCGGFAIWSTTLTAGVRVEYVHPENFTDVSFRSTTHQAAEERLERELTKTIEAAAAQYLSNRLRNRPAVSGETASPSMDQRFAAWIGQVALRD